MDDFNIKRSLCDILILRILFSMLFYMDELYKYVEILVSLLFYISQKTQKERPPSRSCKFISRVFWGRCLQYRLNTLPRWRNLSTLIINRLWSKRWNLRKQTTPSETVWGDRRKRRKNRKTHNRIVKLHKIKSGTLGPWSPPTLHKETTFNGRTWHFSE